MQNAATRSVDAHQTQPTVESISVEERERFISILSFWHKLEFFIPFDLDQRIAEAGEGKIRCLQKQDPNHNPLSLWQVEVEEDKRVRRFKLYLCVFDKSEITKICNRLLGPSQDANEIEEFERTELEGLSCFAQFTIDPKGELILDSTAKSGPASYVSTLPWALGQFEREGLASLTSDRFESAKQDLAGLLLNFKATRKRSTEPDGDKSIQPLTRADLIELYQVLQDWAGISSLQSNCIGFLETIVEPKEDKAASSRTDNANQVEPASDDFEPDIAILNSFFIQDIESAIDSIKSGHVNRSLKEFLSPLAEKDKVDLQTASGLRVILETLHPARLNRGRWFADTNQPMTLMQQFAINSILHHSSKANSLFSVNGPPGTGKTTLLKDIFADLIVRRARVLAALSKPRDAFFPQKRNIGFIGHQSRTIFVLKPELTGFEMVVASSNNAAVENISADLPKMEKLGLNWRDVAYLKPVAYKLAAAGRKVVQTSR